MGWKPVYDVTRQNLIFDQIEKWFPNAWQKLSGCSTIATEPSVQLDLGSGTVCRRTSDSRACHTAISVAENTYLVSGTKALWTNFGVSPPPLNCALEILLLPYFLATFWTHGNSRFVNFVLNIFAVSANSKLQFIREAVSKIRCNQSLQNKP